MTQRQCSRCSTYISEWAEKHNQPHSDLCQRCYDKIVAARALDQVFGKSDDQ